VAITDAWLKANNKREVDREYTKIDRDGLSVRVSPKGKLTFQIRYQFELKGKRLDI